MARIKPQALLQQSKKKKTPSRVSIPTIIIYSLVVVVMVFFLYSTYRHWSQRSGVPTVETFSGLVDGDGTFISSKKSNIPKYAILNTSKGFITVELYKDGSPEVVDEFINLCQKGQFKGMPFHRVIKNFVIQGGDSNQPGATEDWTTRGKHNNHLDTSLKHEAFMLGTSKVKPDKKSFELFITTAPIPDLNEKLIVFGQVIKGEDVVQEIEEVDTDEHYQPKSPIGIINITLKETV